MHAELVGKRVRNVSFSSLELLTGQKPNFSFQFKHSYSAPQDPSDHTVMVITNVKTVNPSESGFSFEMDYDSIFEYAEAPDDLAAFVVEFCLNQANDLCMNYFMSILQVLGIESRIEESTNLS